MDDLITRTELTGRDLVKEIQLRLGPGASIDDVLDGARSVNMHRYANILRDLRHETVLEMAKYIRLKWNLTIQDAKTVLDLAGYTNGLDATIWELAESVPKAPGCFSSLWGAKRHTLPRFRLPCLRRPSQNTRTQGTNQSP